MDQNRFTELETMTTGEIAAAVDARKPWRSLQYCFWRAIHRCAFSLFIFQFFISLGIDMVLNIFISFCVCVGEIYTNRFTVHIYSIHEIVDLLMRRATVERTRNNGLKVVLAATLVFLIGMALAAFHVPLYIYGAFYFIGLAVVVIGIKRFDQPKRSLSGQFVRTETEGGRFYVDLYYPIARYGFACFRPWTGLYAHHHTGQGFLVFPAMILPILYIPIIYSGGGIDNQKLEMHLTVIVTLVISLAGCMIQEQARFYLVHKEMMRTNTEKEKSRLEKMGEMP